MDSMDYPPPPSQLLCPEIRYQSIKDSVRTKHLGGKPYQIIDNSCYLSDAGEEEKSSHLHHLNLLIWCNNKEDEENDFYCEACWLNTIGTIYYYCNGCGECYHKECVESPAVFISPFHPRSPLQLLRHDESDQCHSCGKEVGGLVYYSSICDLFLDPVCAKKEELPTINNKKRHEHTLHYFPRKVSIICDVCGTNDNKICFYICHQCDFVVHRTCVDIPRVIQTSRHSHRLFFTSSLSSEVFSCGVCRQSIDGNYGEYSCSKGCDYAVHCKCALKPDVCDGKELEDEPEKIYDNMESYEEIGNGIIQHFSHPHHNMRFDEDISKVYYEKKHCKACFLPFYDGNIYICIQCEFVLHEACANLPRIKQNMVHPHQFILQPGNSSRFALCTSCRLYTCGFIYKCCEGCEFNNLDVRCASLSEPLHHLSHPHPLFLLIYARTSNTCSICTGKLPLFQQYLNCVKCDFGLCFRCATLPNKVKHADDEHLLTLSYEEDVLSPYWCEVCEEKMDPKKGYYTCSECGTTLHIECILGNDPYMKPGQQTRTRGKTIDIVQNNSLIRPICNHCERRCQYNIVFRRDGKIFCSLSEVLAYFRFRSVFSWDGRPGA